MSKNTTIDDDQCLGCSADDKTKKELEAEIDEIHPYMHSINLIEGVLESSPQLGLKAYVFYRYRIGGGVLQFFVSTLIGILCILRAWFIFVTTKGDIWIAMNALRANALRDSFRPEGEGAERLGPPAIAPYVRSVTPRGRDVAFQGAAVQSNAASYGSSNLGQREEGLVTVAAVYRR